MKETRRIAEEVMRDALVNLRAQGAAGSDIAADIAKFIETLPAPQTQHELYQDLIRDGGYERVAEEFFRRAQLPIRDPCKERAHSERQAVKSGLW